MNTVMQKTILAGLIPLACATALDADIATQPSPEPAVVEAIDTTLFGIESPLFKQGVHLYREALAAYMAGRYLEAIHGFEQVLRLDPLHEECYTLLNRAQEKLGIRKVRKPVGQDTAAALVSRQQELYKAGMEHYARGEFHKARDRWQHLHDLNADYPLLQSYIAKVDAEIAEMSRARAGRERADRLFEKASNLSMRDRVREALPLLDSARALCPAHESAAALASRIRKTTAQAQDQGLQRGMVLFENGAYRKALTAWEKALRLDTTNARLAGHVREAKAQLKEIEKLYRSEAERRYAQGNLRAAIDEYRRLADISPHDSAATRRLAELQEEYAGSVESAYDSAVALFEREAWTEAAHLLDAVLRLDPSHAPAREYLEKSQTHLASAKTRERIAGLESQARTAEQEGRWHEAAASWQDVLALDSSYTTARDRLAFCRDKARARKTDLAIQDMFRQSVALYQQGKVRKARTLWDGILAKDPGNQMVRQMMERIQAETNAQMSRAEKYASRKDWSAAVTAYQRVLKLDPGNAAAGKGLASARAAAQNDAARKERAVDPDKVTVLFNRGLDLYMQKKLDAALVEWNKVLELDPDNQRAKTYIRNLKKKLERLKQL
ncbi:MAG: tetratricopeptide repeat protein [Chitinivibrionales bacterium]|nr:tetratricopeptide repeat protein [Chitinivibrionales bacterium]MBD3396269.1 tetratricopeptide repeat protein [Chitinivibrionales bacterium]